MTSTTTQWFADRPDLPRLEFCFEQNVTNPVFVMFSMASLGHTPFCEQLDTRVRKYENGVHPRLFGGDFSAPIFLLVPYSTLDCSRHARIHGTFDSPGSGFV